MSVGPRQASKKGARESKRRSTRSLALKSVTLDVCGYAPWKARAADLLSTNPRRARKFIRTRIGNNKRALKFEQIMKQEVRN